MLCCVGLCVLLVSDVTALCCHVERAMNGCVSTEITRMDRVSLGNGGWHKTGQVLVSVIYILVNKL